MTERDTVSVNVSEEDNERIERLRVLTAASSPQSVFTSSLKVADELIGRVIRGERLLVRKQDGSLEYLEFNGIKRAGE